MNLTDHAWGYCLTPSKNGMKLKQNIKPCEGIVVNYFNQTTVKPERTDNPVYNEPMYFIPRTNGEIAYDERYLLDHEAKVFHTKNECIKAYNQDLRNFIDNYKKTTSIQLQFFEKELISTEDNNNE